MKTEPELDFVTWRQGLGLTQEEAAEALGLSRRMVQYYESALGPTGRDLQSPRRSVQLAMRYLVKHPKELFPASK